MEDHRFNQAMGTAGLHHVRRHILRNILSWEKDSLTIRHVRVLYRNLTLIRTCEHIDIRNENALLIQDKRLIVHRGSEVKGKCLDGLPIHRIGTLIPVFPLMPNRAGIIRVIRITVASIPGVILRLSEI